MKRRTQRVNEFERGDAAEGAYGGFARALLFALIGFALGSGATFLAWRYNLLALTAEGIASGQPKAPPGASAAARSARQTSVPAGKPPSSEVAALLAAAASDPSAQNDLGGLYQQGKGVEQNDAEALKWYRKAAERGFPLAQSNLGGMLEQGRGVEKDPVSALFWYNLAALGGDPNGQYQLGLMYEQGLGTARDLALALEWFEKVAQQGYTPGRNAAQRVRAALAQEAGAAAQPAAAPSAAAAQTEGETSTGAVKQDAAASPPPPDAAASGAAQEAADSTARNSALSLAIDVDNEFDGSGYAGTWHQRAAPAAASNRVTYQVERRAERVSVTPSSPLHAAGASAPAPAKSIAEALQWQLPRLSLRMDNATTAPLNVAALEVRVRRSEPDRSALVIVPSELSAMLELENIGWGRAVRPQLKLGFAPAGEYEAIDPLSAATTESLDLEDLDESLRVTLNDRVPGELNAAMVAVFGQLSYDAQGAGRRILAFKSLAHFDRVLPQRRWRPRFFHHVLLRAGQTGTTSLPLSASIGAQRGVIVKLRVGSDRSARYELVLALKSPDGALLAAQALDLHVFVPRFAAAAIASSPSKLKPASP